MLGIFTSRTPPLLLKELFLPRELLPGLYHSDSSPELIADDLQYLIFLSTMNNVFLLHALFHFLFLGPRLRPSISNIRGDLRPAVPCMIHERPPHFFGILSESIRHDDSAPERPGLLIRSLVGTATG